MFYKIIFLKDSLFLKIHMSLNYFEEVSNKCLSFTWLRLFYGHFLIQAPGAIHGHVATRCRSITIIRGTGVPIIIRSFQARFQAVGTRFIASSIHSEPTGRLSPLSVKMLGLNRQ